MEYNNLKREWDQQELNLIWIQAEDEYKRG
jgi:hypothetical protein